MNEKKKLTCPWCGGNMPRCNNPASPCFLYYCGEYPGTGIGSCPCCVHVDSKDTNAYNKSQRG